MISRLGDADLHKIVLKHDRMYAFDAVLGAMLFSEDGGRTFTEQFTPRGLIIDFEVDPTDPDRIFAATDTELFRSENGGKGWRGVAPAEGTRLAWPAPDAFYRAVKDGTVERSRDGGGRWERVGEVPGEPYKFKALGARGAAARPQRRHGDAHGRRRAHVDRGVPAVSRAAIAGTLAVCALALLPAAAAAHSLVRCGRAELAYVSADATSLNTLTGARRTDGDVEFRDATVDGGSDPGPCRPARSATTATSGSSRSSARRAGISRVRVDLGEREDKATIALPVPVTLLGGPGADTLDAAARPLTRSAAATATTRSPAPPATDAIDGDQGADTLDGGAGADRIDGARRARREGRLRRRGIASRPTRSTTVAADCETVSRPRRSRRRRTPTRPGGLRGAGRPGRRLDLPAAARQRAVRVVATSSERGSCGLRVPPDQGDSTCRSERAGQRVTVAGGGAILTVRLRGRSLRDARRALARKRNVSLRLGVVATDGAGHSASVRAPRIRLAGRGAAAGHGRRTPGARGRRRRRVRDEVDNCPEHPQRRPAQHGRRRPGRRV